MYGGKMYNLRFLQKYILHTILHVVLRFSILLGGGTTIS